MVKKTKIGGLTLLLLIVLLIFLFLRSTTFQSFVVNRMIKPIEKNGLVHIEFQESGFNLFEGFQLKNLDIKTKEGEELLRMKEFRISPKNTLLALLRDKFDFERVLVDGLHVNVRHKLGEQHHNWQKLLASFAGGNENREGKPVNISFEHLDLYDCSVVYSDEPNGLESHFHFTELQLKLNDFDLSRLYFNISELLVLNPNLEIRNCPAPHGPSESKPEEKADSESSARPTIFLGELSVLDGQFHQIGLTSDLRDIERRISNIDILLEDLQFYAQDSFYLIPKDISFTHSNGFRLEHMGGNAIQTANGELQINDLVLRSSHSLARIDGKILNADGVLNFGGFSDLSYDLNIENSIIHVQDFLSWLPGLKNSDWVKRSRNQRAYLNSKVSGRLNDLHFTNTYFSLPDLFTYSGEMDLYNLTNPDKTLLNLTIDRALINPRRFEQLYPMITLPEEMIRLGNIEMEGFFDGFKNSFATTAKVNSQIGAMDIDIQFDISKENQYSGTVELHSFDLGALVNNPDFGTVSLSADIKEGRGFSLDEINASFLATVDTLQYKGYEYSNIEFSGVMSHKAMDGILKVNDPNLDFYFDGNVNFAAEQPRFNFQAEVNKADLCAINLSEFPCEISFDADIDMIGKELNNIVGNLQVNSLQMSKDDKDLSIEYVRMQSFEVSQGMLFDIASNEIDGKVRGVFDLLSVHKVILGLLVQDYPDIAVRLGVEAPMGVHGTEEFDIAVDVKNISEILAFIESKQLQNIVGEFRGRWNYNDGLSTNSFNVKTVDLSGLSFDNIVFNLDSDHGIGGFELFIDRVIQENRVLEGFDLTTHISGDTIAFRIQNDVNQLNRFDISGKAIPWENGYKVRFDKQLLNIDSIEWLLDPDASIAFQKDVISIDNFVLQGEEMLIILDDIDQEGILLSMKGFDLSVINPFVDYDKMHFDGTVYMDIRANDILSDRRIDVSMEVPDFTINRDTFGLLSLRAWEKNNERIDLALNVNLDTQIMEVRGYYDLAKNYIDTDIDLIKYPMSIFEYIIDDGISETRGTADLKATISGPIDDLKLDGEGVIKEAGTKIDYLGAFYRIEDQKVLLDENYVELTNAQLLDDQGNIATITGGLRHNMLGDFRADLSISSDNFIGLQTTEEDNELYYGTGIGNITVSFLGPFDAIDIKVDAITHSGSSVNIPIASTEYTIDKGFINFDYKSKQETSSGADELLKALRLKGVDFEMNLSFTPDADVYVIFDRRVNEILEAQGTGNIQLFVKRDGTFEAFGDYEVESGRYLYSAYGFIAKPFIIRRGGIVRWTGDPYNALLDVEADYSGMRAPLDVFLSEFLVSASESVQQEAKSRTNVTLTLLLGGTLFEPTVNFDIDFPDVNGELKTYTDNKMRSLRTTENGINNQVFGLLVLNNFLPNNNPLANISGNTIGQTGNNTIQEFISSQLSVLVSEYLSRNISDDSFIQGIDLDIALSQNTSFFEGQSRNLVSGLVDFVPDEFGVNVRPDFKNDNLVLNVGTNYVRETISNNQNYLTGDFALDWFITEDKRLKLRFYGDFDYDEAFAQRKQKYGFGINYRREFGKLSDITRTLEKIAEEVNRLSTQ